MSKSLLFLVLIASCFVAPSQASELRAHLLKVADMTESGKYVRHRFLSHVEKPFDTKDARKKMLVIGDSHAQDFYNALVENGLDKRYQIRTRRIPAICGVYLGTENITPLIEPKHVPNCKKSDTLANALPQIKQSDVVIIAANWKLWSAQRLKTTVQNLSMLPSQRLFVVGRKNFGNFNLRQFLRMPAAKLKTIRNPVHGAQQEINRVMKATLPANVFVDIQQLICRSEDDCPLFTSEPRLISYDGGHLTPQGARYIGSIVLKHPPLNQL